MKAAGAPEKSICKDARKLDKAKKKAKKEEKNAKRAKKALKEVAAGPSDGKAIADAVVASASAPSMANGPMTSFDATPFDAAILAALKAAFSAPSQIRE